jgi:sarcosine oxidase delta subunit
MTEATASAAESQAGGARRSRSWLFDMSMHVARANAHRPVTAAPPKKRNADRLRSIAERYRSHPGIRHFLLRLLAVLGASFLMGVLVLICERPDHLPANPSGNREGIEVMQVIAQAKASRGADVAEMTEAEINGYLHQRAGPRGFLFGDWCRFDGVLLSFRSGICYTFTRYVFFGFEFYLSGIYRAEEDAGRPIFKNYGGAIGRMPVAPAFMRIAQELFFGETWRGLMLERETINRFGQVEFGQGTVRLVPMR